ncbi:c-type cytochrome biogenesis protein CcmI [Limnohabitans sp. Rim8]|uniref:c-type cytochrome biogenesis protein CcmI n=1 Tax=Limnohabitans sp. Rim8 TaxID=1100718 RepID=UPI0026390847|nr:c-type cytochrome biogenesis protein CcmI [Limnohabitans sp. Rim8]
MNSNFVFILIALALTAVVVVVLMWGLLRSRLTPEHKHEQANTKVYRPQLLDLEKEHAEGVISALSFEQTRAELLGRMLEDTAQTENATGSKSPRALVSAMVLAVLLPVAAMSTYVWLGQPQGLDPQMTAAEASQQPDLQAMADSLAQKLQTDSSDPQRWVMLGRTYRALNQYDKALPAYQKALDLRGDDDIALERAEVLALRRGGDFSGEPWAVIRQVLAKNARHFNGLALAGSASYAQGDYKKAIQYWQLARSELNENDEELKGLDIALNTAREKAGEPAMAPKQPAPSQASVASTVSASGAALSGRVSIDPTVKAQIAPTDVVFVYATPTDGQKMPLAILRKTVDNLPFDFVLDDSMAMNSASKLSSQTKVMLKVRISKSGEAMTRSGDWMGVLENVAVGSRNLKLVVNQQAP